MNDKLKRVIGLPLLTFYGVGTILGAGVYVLIGKIAAVSGFYTPWAFLLSAIIAGLTGYSYAHLSARFPKSGGEAHYIKEVFSIQSLATIIGYGILLTGIVSGSTIIKGFVGYLHALLPLDTSLLTISTLFTLTIFAWYGIKESLIISAIITIIEIFGLLIIIFAVGGSSTTIVPHQGMFEITYVLNGAFLAFYAFIGFEDMVNIAEEVKAPKKTMPRGIYLAIIISAVLYMLVAIIAIKNVPLDLLSNSKAPFYDIIKNSNSDVPAEMIGIISLIAIINGALVQIIMGSRLLYGMANDELAPRIFGKVGRRNTPTVSTLFIATIILILALNFELSSLASAASFIILFIFTFINFTAFKSNDSSLKYISFTGMIFTSLLLGYKIFF